MLLFRVGLYSTVRVNWHFTERRDSCRKLGVVNGTMLRKTICQTEASLFAVCSTVEFHL